MPETPKFNGVINVDIRDSVPDWAPYVAPKAPEGAPNVLVVLFDDTGQAAWEPYGGRINMPTLSKLAANGVTYTQWHTTALCSPTRSCFLTGRNHHQNGCSVVSEGTVGFPGGNGHIPLSCGTLASVMQQNGWNTYWLGKNHNVPLDELGLGGTKRAWPLQRGWDRFYGFLGGEANQYYPDLTVDNHKIDQPYQPEEGYHLSKDLADQAITMLRDARQTNPSRPFFMWFCPGANHAPHQVAAEWADKYKGMFDDGYDAYREWCHARMIERGILPEGTALSPLNPMPEGTFPPGDTVRPWDSLNDDEKRLFARLAEVFAGFSEFTDHQVGRIIEYLETTGQLENTIVIYASDNGSSGEGSPNGSVNENKFFNAWPDTVEENMPLIDKLGSPDTYEHYPTGWAAAFSTPYKMFKRYSYAGGTADPLVISWPAGIKAKGEIRHQYHHVTDLVPTILDCVGLEFPDTLNGVAQVPLPGVSMRYSFDDAAAPTHKHVQHYSMLGTRAIWQDGWKAVAVHGPNANLGHFDDDVWELYDLEHDRSESHNLAQENPERLRQLIESWYTEAGKYNVLPLDDRSQVEVMGTPRPSPEPPRDTYIYFPDCADVPEQVAANTRGRSYKILANVELTEPDAEGILFAMGSRFGGHALFIKERKLWYVYNFLGIPPEQQFVSGELAPGRYTLGMAFEKEQTGEHGESLGTTTLYVNDEAVASGPMRTQTGHFSLAGDGLTIGRDSADPVSKEYGAGFSFRGGHIQGVAVTVASDAYHDLELQAAAAMARD
ncbi:MAG: arylsulfatase [Thermomicrobiales bacterium]